MSLGADCIRLLQILFNTMLRPYFARRLYFVLSILIVTVYRICFYFVENLTVNVPCADFVKDCTSKAENRSTKLKGTFKFLTIAALNSLMTTLKVGTVDSKRSSVAI